MYLHNRLTLPQSRNGQTFRGTQFHNEIIWKRQTAHSDTKQGSKHYGRLHDTILFYAKSVIASYTWNTQYTPYEQEYIDRMFWDTAFIL
jgi:hypothetical protein